MAAFLTQLKEYDAMKKQTCEMQAGNTGVIMNIRDYDADYI